MVSTAPPAPRKPDHGRSRLPGVPLFIAVCAAAVLGAGVGSIVHPEAQVPPQLDLGQLLDEVDGALNASPVVFDTAAPPAWMRRSAPGTPLPSLVELQNLKASLIASGAVDPTTPPALAERTLFIDATHRFLQLRADGGDGFEMRALVGLIEPALTERARRGEVPIADARALKAMLLEAQLDDTTARANELARWSDLVAMSTAR